MVTFIFQMIQAIQVLRFHLLELEKVIVPGSFWPRRHFRPMSHICINVFLQVGYN